MVAGGEHITALTEYCLRDCPSLDVCVRGEGEYTFYQLLEAYLGTGDFLDVPGIAYIKKEDQYQQNGNKPPRMEDAKIPWPDWPENYLEKFWEAGKSYGVATERDMPFMLSRGCPFQCTFCSSPQMWTTAYYLRSVKDVISEMIYYKEKYNISGFQFYDLTAIIKRDWIIEFL